MLGAMTVGLRPQRSRTKFFKRSSETHEPRGVAAKAGSNAHDIEGGEAETHVALCSSFRCESGGCAPCDAAAGTEGVRPVVGESSPSAPVKKSRRWSSPASFRPSLMKSVYPIGGITVVLCGASSSSSGLVDS